MSNFYAVIRVALTWKMLPGVMPKLSGPSRAAVFLIGCWMVMIGNPPAAVCDEIRYRILTYNIRYDNPGDKEDGWLNRKNAVIQTILQADIVGLQEVLANQQEAIERETPGWQWAAVGRDDGLRRGEMCSLGWRVERFVAVESGTFWLSPSPLRIGQAAWDAALPRIATWTRLVPRSAIETRRQAKSKSADELKAPSGVSPSERDGSSAFVPSLLVINTHFDHRGAEARRQSGALIRRWIGQHRGESEVLLIGDLNAKIGSPPLEELLGQDRSEHPALVDTRLLADLPDPGPDSTWNGFREIVPGQRIDHILYLGQRLRFTAYHTLDPRTESGRFASDHLPILVEFTGLP